MSGESNDVQTMADLLRKGATLTELSCPECSSPLFKLRSGNLWCGRCRRRVIVVRDEEHITEATSNVLLNGLESTLLTKIQDTEKEIKREKDLEKLQQLATFLSTLLQNLERIRKIKRD